jgi:hypothetical protein
MSSLDPKDAVPDYSSLNEAQRKTLDQWETFFEKVRPLLPRLEFRKEIARDTSVQCRLE